MVIPNPGESQYLNFAASGDGIIEYRIMDYCGKFIAAGSGLISKGQNVIPLKENLKHGFYLIEILAEGQTFRLPFVRE